MKYRLKKQEGFALVLVLIIVSFAAAIAVLFLLSAQQERSGTDSYAEGSRVRQLASTAVNLVMGQINAATKQGTVAQPISWASQPGMIRTYNTTGGLNNAFKLYSWPNMVEGNAFNPQDPSELPPSTWSTLPEQYTDLNLPVNNVYPIVDPAAKTQVEDFSIDATNPAVTGSTSNTAPMPVQWLYILQDGTWVYPQSVSGTTATFDSGVVTAANPIVGRIAYWTDDETCKVNINTASEGAYWDWPKAASHDEMQFAGNPPVKNEFNRIPGHPATTSLSAVFPEMRNGTFNRWSALSTYSQQLQDIFSIVPRIDWSVGGSKGGTYPITSLTTDYNPSFGSYIAPSTYSPIVLDANRLYATPSDFWFQPNRTANAFANSPYNLTTSTLSQRLFFLTASSNAPETTLFETPRISLWPLTYPNKSSFFFPFSSGTTFTVGGVGGTTGRPSPPTTILSPNSSTPSIIKTLAGLNYITPQEELVDFCSTLNPSSTTAWQPYFFQRINPDSPQSNAGKSELSDWSDITRNQNLVTYLRNEMGQVPPGFGNGLSLANKWGSSNADWIALNCFDFSRSQVNQYTYDPNSANGNLLYSYTGVSLRAGTVANHAVQLYSEANTDTVAPLRASFNGKTYVTEGTYPTLKEVALMFYVTGRNLPSPPLLGGSVDPTKVHYAGDWTNLISYNPSGPTGNTQTTSMQGVMLFSFAGLNPGNDSYCPVFWIKVTGGAFTISGAPITAGGTLNIPSASGSSLQVDLRTTGNNPNPDLAPLIYKQYNQPKVFTNGSTGASAYPLISGPVTINPANGLTFNFTSSGTTTVSIYAPYSTNMDTDPTNDPNQLVSSQQIDFSKWNGSLPIPIAPRWNINQGAMTMSGTAAPPAGVVMPDPTSTGDPVAPPPGWAIEVVPGVQAYNSYASTASLSQDPAVSVIPKPSATTNSFGTTPASLYYAFAGTVTAPTTSGPTTPINPATLSGTTLNMISTDIRCRVAAMSDITSDTKQYSFTAEGSANPLFTNSAFNVRGVTLITPYDTVISMVCDPSTTIAGDQRLMGRGDTSVSTPFVRIDKAMTGFAPSPVIKTAVGQTSYVTSGSTGVFPLWNTYEAQFHQLGSPGANRGESAGLPMSTGYVTAPTFGGVIGTAYTNPMATHGRGINKPASTLLGSRPLIDSQVGQEGNVTMNLGLGYDWTSMPGWSMDGAYVARPDQDYQVLTQEFSDTSAQMTPYFQGWGSYSASSGAVVSGAFFMPNRQIPSPVVLGTLPSDMNTGWQTLAFSPNPAKTMNGVGTHPGPGTLSNLASPAAAVGAAYSALPDHLLLDLFWMPVAEPYPISANFATAGKVNLNYAMMPFPYIQRKTALDAVLKSVWLYAIPLTGSGTAGSAAAYKSYYNWITNYASQHTRYPIAVDETLKAFDNKFSTGDIFRSASQICDMFLYPSDPNTANTPLVSWDSANANITAWWKTQQLTSDNGREEPYNAIYSRITTKSNTYTVHWKVQSLQKITVNGSNPATWTEGKDRITSELRGSTLIERYLDPNANPPIPDYADPTVAPTALPLSNFYKWRIDAETYFQPPS